MRTITMALAAAIPLLTSGCSKDGGFRNFMDKAAHKVTRPASTTDAMSDVTKFHDFLNTEQFDKIYLSADADFRKQTTEQSFVTMLTSVHDELGNYKSAILTDSSTKTYSFAIEAFSKSKSTITLTYTAYFKKGSATEKFVFVAKNSPLLLDKYHIDSRLLNHS